MILVSVGNHFDWDVPFETTRHLWLIQFNTCSCFLSRDVHDLSCPTMGQWQRSNIAISQVQQPVWQTSMQTVVGDCNLRSPSQIYDCASEKTVPL